MARTQSPKTAPVADAPETTPETTETTAPVALVLPGQIAVSDPDAIRAILRSALGAEPGADIPESEYPTTIVVQLPKASRPAPPCGCGCGDRTRGGRYIPGHDAKHKSALHDRVRNGDTAAAAELTERGWPQPAPKKAKKAKAEAATEAAA